ncbi:protein S100-G-like [Leptodactylus fuscus]|uniref:protein S100-G-like n=1 Tax=Leptodactylus fuscus TaxID=238119 RepID=UPI003F4F315A
MRALLIVLLLLMGSNPIWMQNGRDPSVLESNGDEIPNEFNRFAKMSGNSKNLSEEEYKLLLKNSFPTLLEDLTKKLMLNISFQISDTNGDKEIDLSEFNIALDSIINIIKRLLSLKG